MRTRVRGPLSHWWLGMYTGWEVSWRRSGKLYVAAFKTVRTVSSTFWEGVANDNSCRVSQRVVKRTTDLCPQDIHNDPFDLLSSSQSQMA